MFHVPPPAVTFQQLVELDREQAWQHFDPLTDTYARELRKLSREAAAAYTQHQWGGPSPLAAAADDPGPARWRIPDPDEVLNLERAAARLHTSADKLRRVIARASVAGTLSHYGIDFSLSNPLLRDVYEQLGTHIRTVASALRSDVMRVIQESYDQGLSIRNTSLAINREIAGTARAQAERIARTEITSATAGGSVAAARLVNDASPPEARLRKIWIATGDIRTRESHRMAADQYGEGHGIPLEQPFSVGGYPLLYPGGDGPPEEVVNCFPEDTLVELPGIRAVTRHWYEGYLVRVSFAGGDHLTGSPNHPILGPDGYWSPLRTFRKGDYCVRGRLTRQHSAEPDVEHRPAQIGEVYRAAHSAGRAERIAATPPDLHGDVTDSEVEVVTVDGYLGFHLHAATDEQVREFGFSLAYEARTSLSRGERGILPGRLPWRGHGLTTPARLVRSPDVSALLFGGTGGGEEAVSVAARTGRMPGVYDPPYDEWAADAEVAGEAGDALTVQVTVDEIIDVDVLPFQGYLLNVDTGEGYYIANGVVAANCRCTVGYEQAQVTAPPVEEVPPEATGMPFEEAAIARDEVDWDTFGLDEYNPHTALTTDDPLLKRMAGARGYTRTPDLAPGSAITEQADQGGVELWRGNGNAAHADEYLRGDYYAGTGVDGNGTYFTTSRADAEKFTGTGSTLVRGVIKRDARIIEIQDLRAERDAALAQIEKEAEAAKNRVYDRMATTPGPEQQALYDEVRRIERRAEGRAAALDDLGRFAVYQGYDVIQSAQGIYVVVNRTALTVADHAYAAGEVVEATAAATGIEARTVREAIQEAEVGADGIRATSGPTTVYRVGSTANAPRGVFFSESREATEDYATLHPGEEIQEYVVHADRTAVFASHRDAWEHLFPGRAWKGNESREALRRAETKIATQLRANGYDSYIIESPFTNPNSEFVWVSKQPFKSALREEAPPPGPPAGGVTVQRESYGQTWASVQHLPATERSQILDVLQGRGAKIKADATLTPFTVREASGELRGVGTLAEHDAQRIRIGGIYTPSLPARQDVLRAMVEEASTTGKRLIYAGNDEVLRNWLRDQGFKETKTGLLVMDKAGQARYLATRDERLTLTQLREEVKLPGDRMGEMVFSDVHGYSAESAGLVDQKPPGMHSAVPESDNGGETFIMRDSADHRFAVYIERGPTQSVEAFQAEAERQLRDLARYLDMFPAERRNLNEVVLHQARNPHDARSAAYYGIPGFRSAASAGNDYIVFWNGNRVTRDTIEHEMGHMIGSEGEVDLSSFSSFAQEDLRRTLGANADRWLDYNRVGGPGGRVTQTEWLHAVDDDRGINPPAGFQPPPHFDGHWPTPSSYGVTDYGGKTMGEDWAESISLYLYDREYGRIGISLGNPSVRFADLWPNRAALLDRVFGDTATRSVRASAVVADDHVPRFVVLGGFEHVPVSVSD